jgi:hypothetical protein
MAEDAAPAIATVPARVVGGALSAAAIPGGPALQGARYGALNALGQSDQDASLKTRVDNAGLGMAVGAGSAAVAQNASRIPWGGIAKAIHSPRATAVKAVGGVLRDALGEAHAPLASQVAESIVPTVDGFVGNGMGNLADAATEAGPRRLVARRPSTPVIPPRPSPAMLDAFSNEAQVSDQAIDHSLPDVVKAAERYRTGSGALQQRAPSARFDWFADRMAQQQAAADAAAAGVEPDLIGALEQSLKLMKKGGKAGFLRIP